MFSRYHYLTHDLKVGAKCFGLFDKENIIGFCAVIHFPSPTNKKLKHCHRLVILPDYQGIGLGVRFLTEVAKIYKNQGFDFSIITSAKNLMGGLKRRPDWVCQFYGHQHNHKGPLGKMLRKTGSAKRITASFFYVGEKNGK